MGLFDKFQALVGRDQGATRLFVRIGGYFNVGDEASANGTDVTGVQMKGMLLSPVTQTRVSIISAPTVNSVLAVGYGAIVLRTTITAASVKLPSAMPGHELLINADGVLSVAQLLPGNASLATLLGSDLSRIDLTTSAVSNVWLRLACYTQGEWSVAARSGPGAMPQASA